MAEVVTASTTIENSDNASEPVVEVNVNPTETNEPASEIPDITLWQQTILTELQLCRSEISEIRTELQNHRHPEILSRLEVVEESTRSSEAVIPVVEEPAVTVVEPVAEEIAEVPKKKALRFL